LAEELDIPLRVVREILSLLVQTGYVTATAGESPNYIPARELDRITIMDVLKNLKNHGDECWIIRMTAGEKRLQEILARLDAGTAAALEGMTLKELVGEPLSAESSSRGVNDFPH
jgi:membrane protein